MKRALLGAWRLHRTRACVSDSVSGSVSSRCMATVSHSSEDRGSRQSAHEGSGSDSGERTTPHDDDWQSVLYSAFTFFMLLHAVEEFYTITTCVGPSMLPTFKEDGDVVIVERLDHSKSLFGRLLFNSEDDVVNSKQKDKKSELWKRNIYKKGDAVISYCKDDLGKTVCKRVAALEGERVSYRGNGIMPMMVRVPPGHVWLLGDNPQNSKDSRTYGPVPMGLIQGRIVCKLNIPYGFFSPDKKVIEWVDHVYPVPKPKKKIVKKVLAKVDKTRVDPLNSGSTKKNTDSVMDTQAQHAVLHHPVGDSRIQETVPIVDNGAAAELIVSSRSSTRTDDVSSHDNEKSKDSSNDADSRCGEGGDIQPAISQGSDATKDQCLEPVHEAPRPPFVSHNNNVSNKEEES